MPFINEESRELYPDTTSVHHNLEAAVLRAPGDRCFIFYREMIRAWRESPRWTTAHHLYRDLKNEMPYLGVDDQTAYSLAWQVFFALYVMPYEVAKREENGEVE